MLFNSYTFVIFFLIVYCLYWTIKEYYQKQNLLLFIASYVFYGWWDSRFLILLVFSTFIDYTSSIIIDKKSLTIEEKLKSYSFLLIAAILFVNSQQFGISLSFPFLIANEVVTYFYYTWRFVAIVVLFLVVFELIQWLCNRNVFGSKERFFLIWSIVLNLSILSIFKYFNFFAETFIELWSKIFGTLPTEFTFKIVLPVGISFFIFQTISHTFDVYRKKIVSTDSIIELGTYISFFPQLVAGPIERGAHLLPQFQTHRFVSKDEKKEAIWLIAWGLYKKVVVADNVSKIVNEVFGPYDSLLNSSIPDDGLLCLAAVYAFSIQIYCDFSGYTDIARGTARLLGFDIMLNFKLPYFATNPSDFWRRWHISLSSWLRDYLYIPLGGNRNGVLNMYRNLMITMLLGGLWHGAAWNFIYWGAFHGILLVIYNLFNQRQTNSALTVGNLLRGFFMFHLVCVGWLLFRAQNMSTIYLFSAAIFKNLAITTQAISAFKQILFYSWFLIGFQCAQAFTNRLYLLTNMHWFIKLNIWIFIVTSIFTFSGGKAQEFIYFAF